MTNLLVYLIIIPLRISNSLKRSARGISTDSDESVY